MLHVLGQKIVCRRLCTKHNLWYASYNSATVGRIQEMPIFLQMANEEVGHPSKLKMHLLTLIGRLCRPKWHFASCNWYVKLGTLHTENYLLVNLSFVHGTKGDGATLPSCAIVNKSIDASDSLLEEQMVHCFMQLVCKVIHFTNKKNIYV